MASAVVTRLLTLAGITTVSRILAPDDFGRLTLIQATILLGAGLAGLGLPITLSRHVAHTRASDPAETGRYLGAAIAVTISSASVATLSLIFGREWVAGAVLRNEQLAALVPAGAAAVGAIAVAAITQAGLAGLERFRALATIQFVQGALSAAGMVFGASTHSGDAEGALIGFACGHGVAAVLAYWLVRHRSAIDGIRFSLSLRPHERRALASFAIPALVAGVVVSGALLIGQVVLSDQPGGYSRVAEFAVAYRWHLAILFIPAAIAPLMVPVLTRMRRHDADDARHAFRFLLLGNVVIAALPAGLFAVAAPEILRLNGHEYADHPLPLVILAAAAVPCAINNVLSSAAISVGAIRVWVLSDIALAVGLVGLAVAMVPNLDASGLAFAYLGGYIVTNLVLAPTVLATVRSDQTGPA